MLLANRKASQPSVVLIRSQDVLPAAIGEPVLRTLRAAERRYRNCRSCSPTHSALANLTELPATGFWVTK